MLIYQHRNAGAVDNDRGKPWAVAFGGAGISVCVVSFLDVLKCPKCLGPLTVIAYLTESLVVGKILAHLGLPTEPPPISPARRQSQMDFFDENPTLNENAQHLREPWTSSKSRAPPTDNSDEDVSSRGEFDDAFDAGDWGA